LRFHDLRRVEEWMRDADVATTMKNLHYVERPDEARLVAEAFAVDDVEPKNEKDRLGGRSNPFIGRPPLRPLALLRVVAR
jgi:hypothetical protein